MNAFATIQKTSEEVYPTGAELFEAIRTEAVARGTTPLDLVRPLTPFPSAWLRQIAAAAQPKPLTIQRVRALIAGRPIPDKLDESAVISAPRGDPEKIVLQALIDAAESGVRCPTNTEVAKLLGCDLNWSGGEVLRRLEMRGLISVRRFKNSRDVTIVATGARTAEAGTEEERALLAEIAVPPSLPAAVLIPLVRPQAAVAPYDADPRPPAWSRDPCSRCAVRGDLGCAHQRPFEPIRMGAGR